MFGMIEFIRRIENDKKEIYKKQIEIYNNAHEFDNFWGGPTLEIEDVRDIFFYISEDKKSLYVSGENAEPAAYSYLIYFNYRYEVNRFRNGGVKLIGFYDSAYRKVDEIPIGDFKITGCKAACNFDAIIRPTFGFSLEHKDGNKHRSFYGNAFDATSCKKVLESIWDLDTFYKDFSRRIQRSLN